MPWRRAFFCNCRQICRRRSIQRIVACAAGTRCVRTAGSGMRCGAHGDLPVVFVLERLDARGRLLLAPQPAVQEEADQSGDEDADEDDQPIAAHFAPRPIRFPGCAFAAATKSWKVLIGLASET